jgi:elongation factor G
MKKYEPEAIRNVGIFSHGGEGKTSIVEAMLFWPGDTRLGSVDEGTSLMDYEPEEVERKITISSTLACFEWAKNKINLLDTPGDDNFISDAKLCMRVVDAAVIVMSAVSGVKVGTEKVWGYASEFGAAAAIFVNKMDRERADFIRTVEDIQRTLLTGRALSRRYPWARRRLQGGRGPSYHEVPRLQGDGSGSFDVVDIPAEQLDLAQKFREKLVETAVEIDDEVMERYLNGDEISPEEIEKCLKAGIAGNKIVPIFCGSAVRNIGVSTLLDGIVKLFPAPSFKKEVEAINPKTGEKTTRESSAGQPFSALVFKTITDPFAGKLTLFRVYSGELHPDMTVLNVLKDEKERIGQIFSLVGKKQKPAGSASAGDIAVVAKLKDVQTGDTICDEKSPIRYEGVTVPNRSYPSRCSQGKGR